MSRRHAGQAVADDLKAVIERLDDGEGVLVSDVIVETREVTGHSEARVDDALELLTAAGEVYRPGPDRVRVTG